MTASTLHALHVDTRFAPLSVLVESAADGDVVVGAAYRPLDDLLSRHLAVAGDAQVRTASPRHAAMRQVMQAVRAYDDGDLDAFDALAVRQRGGAFMQSAWSALRGVRAGSVVSYAGLAALAGRPTAIRAAGTACATNHIAPFVPCHRVVRTGGDIGNYGFGPDLKRRLLVHEGALRG